MTDLPAGWIWVDLADVADVQGGIQKQAKRRPVLNKYPFLRVANVHRGKLDLADVHEVELFDGELERFELRRGDLLVVEGNGSPDQIGRAATWDGSIDRCVHQNHLIRVRPTGALLHDFLELVWNSPLVARHLREVAGSTSGLYTLSVGKLKSVRLPLPPLAEQRRIVATLEYHLSRSGAASALLQAAHRRSARLRQRIVSAIVEPTERSGSDEALVTIGDLATVVRNGIFVSRAGIEPNGVPILRIGAVRPLLLDRSDLRYTGLSADELGAINQLVREGDLLFTRYNGSRDYVGACAVVPPAVGELTYPDKLIRVVLDRSRACPEYVAMACSVGRGRRQIEAMIKTTAGQAGISNRDLKLVELSLPSVEEQAERVARYKLVDAELKRVEESLTQLVQRDAWLRNSLLSEAFNGRLGAQDFNDEPASELLSRIKAERAATSAPSKQKTRSRRTQKELAAPPTRVTGDDYQQEALPL
ncbi:restriction endonuclease subunit S [Micromonospora sp. WMMD729]|uniref:restriction endonuclease subunit S n=1 Tax=Micromonospora sp. WMMD729 TaxID=3404127 RepID=UPI003BF5C494